MIGEFSNIEIKGIQVTVPQKEVNNLDYEPVLGSRRTKKQIKLTGVHKRRVALSNQRASDLCYISAKKLMEQLKWKTEDIKAMVLITQAPNYNVPSTAFFIQMRLGLPKECLAFDINLGCSSCNVGLQVVSSIMQQCKLGDKALLLLGDTSGKTFQTPNEIDSDGIAGRMLFGTAGAALGIEIVENHKMQFMNMSDGTGYDAIISYSNRPTSMDGAKVFDFAINDVSHDLKLFRDYFKIADKDIDYYVFHQAQELILDNIVASCGIEESKELRTVNNYGNTSGTSIPLSICANRERFANQDKIKMLLCGFGVGLSWGYIYTEIDTKAIFPVIETDEHYDEDKNPNQGLGDKNILVIGADTEEGMPLSNIINGKSAHVLLAGKDKDKLYNVREDFLYKEDIILYKENYFEAIEKDYSEKIEGIVIFDKNINKEKIEKINQMIEESDCFEDNTSIVVVTDQFIDEKFRKNIDMVDVSNKRINVISYDSATIEFDSLQGDRITWFEKYIKEVCPTNMKRMMQLGEAITYLLSDNSLFVKNNIIFIRE